MKTFVEIYIYFQGLSGIYKIPSTADISVEPSNDAFELPSGNQ